MSRVLQISPRAALDLIDLAAYIELDSLDASIRFQEAAARALERLLELPELGAARPGVNPRLADLRMWPIPDFPNHLIYYRPGTVTVAVVRVLHAGRDREGLLSREE